MPASRSKSPSDPAAGEVWRALWGLFRAFGPELRRIAHSAGITLPQLAMLQACQQGSVTATELARRSDRTAPAITYLTRELETSGLLRRMPSTRDRRRVVFSLTAKGRATLERVHMEGERWDRDLSASLSREEWRALARGIEELADQVESYPHAPDSAFAPRVGRRKRSSSRSGSRSESRATHI